MDIDFAALIKIVPIFTLAMISPGPDFVLISSMALSRGHKAAMQAAAGIAVGVMVYVALTLWGFSLVVHMIGDWIWIVRVLGGLYLIYLGYQLWCASLQQQPEHPAATETISKRQNHPFWTGFVTNMTNPKAFAFFTSIFAVALDEPANLATQLTVTVVLMLMPFLWFTAVGYCLSAPPMQQAYRRWSKWIDRAAGTFLALFGLKMLFAGGK